MNGMVIIHMKVKARDYAFQGEFPFIRSYSISVHTQ